MTNLYDHKILELNNKMASENQQHLHGFLVQMKSGARLKFNFNEKEIGMFEKYAKGDLQVIHLIMHDIFGNAVTFLNKGSIEHFVERKVPYVIEYRKEGEKASGGCKAAER